jgi:hypothetical protein
VRVSLEASSAGGQNFSVHRNRKEKEKKKLTGTSPHNPTDWTISLLAVHTQIKKETAISSALASQKLKNWNSIEGDD